MYTLFIDTHYKNLLILLFKDDIIVDKYEVINIKNQSEFLVPGVDKLLVTNSLSSSDLDEIIVVNGPGSFTGVRLGVTVAKTLAYLNDIPVKVISSLQVLAACVDKEVFKVATPENNGYFIGTFNNDFLNPTYEYIKNSELDTFVTSNIIEEIDNVDYEQVIHKSKLLPYVNPHLVNPLYVKVIEVQNDKKSKA